MQSKEFLLLKKRLENVEKSIEMINKRLREIKELKTRVRNVPINYSDLQLTGTKSDTFWK